MSMMYSNTSAQHHGEAFPRQPEADKSLCFHSSMYDMYSCECFNDQIGSHPLACAGVTIISYKYMTIDNFAKKKHELGEIMAKIIIMAMIVKQLKWSIFRNYISFGIVDMLHSCVLCISLVSFRLQSRMHTNVIVVACFKFKTATITCSNNKNLFM